MFYAIYRTHPASLGNHDARFLNWLSLAEVIFSALYFHCIDENPHFGQSTLRSFLRSTAVGKAAVSTHLRSLTTTVGERSPLLLYSSEEFFGGFENSFIHSVNQSIGHLWHRHKFQPEAKWRNWIRTARRERKYQREKKHCRFDKQKKKTTQNE